MSRSRSPASSDIRLPMRRARPERLLIHDPMRARCAADSDSPSSSSASRRRSEPARSASFFITVCSSIRLRSCAARVSPSSASRRSDTAVCVAASDCHSRTFRRLSFMPASAPATLPACTRASSARARSAAAPRRLSARADIMSASSERTSASLPSAASARPSAALRPDSAFCDAVNASAMFRSMRTRSLSRASASAMASRFAASADSISERTPASSDA